MVSTFSVPGSVRRQDKSALEGLLDSYDDKVAAEEVAERGRDRDIREFEEAFAEVCGSAVRPALEEFGRALEAHGHHFRVIERERYIDLNGRIRRSAIELEIRPKSGGERRYDADQSTPSLSVTSYPESEEVMFIERKASASSGEHEFPRGTCRIDQLSKELVDGHLIAVAAEIFR